MLSLPSPRLFLLEIRILQLCECSRTASVIYCVFRSYLVSFNFWFSFSTARSGERAWLARWVLVVAEIVRRVPLTHGGVAFLPILMHLHACFGTLKAALMQKTTSVHEISERSFAFFTGPLQSSPVHRCKYILRVLKVVPVLICRVLTTFGRDHLPVAAWGVDLGIALGQITKLDVFC